MGNGTEVEGENICTPLSGTPRVPSPLIPVATQQVGIMEVKLLKSR